MSFHRCMNFIVFASAVLLNGIQAISPPSSVELVFPIVDHIPVPNNITIGTAGFDVGNAKEYVGLSSDVSISVTYPNSTSKLLLAVSGCGAGPGGSTGTFLMDQEGTYTFVWNVTFGISSDPSQVNSSTSACGPGPFSYQSLFVNKTLTGGGNSGGGGIKPLNATTVASSLPTVPTGQVVLNGARRRSEMCLMSLAVVMGAYLVL
ncbi:hypothetical protein BDP27DRAFT_524872 [Rhodocollybia butyracea]|uniref:Uncharacterized protein n=1 Tax=Rhodocollybia butyracea TaxID=206335 RepID=A0A9P5U9S9_9AGAR|nr:hypothetical protein BDP27DRAFT_524872 [Rhodocollybia butyracea]